MKKDKFSCFLCSCVNVSSQRWFPGEFTCFLLFAFCFLIFDFCFFLTWRQGSYFYGAKLSELLREVCELYSRQCNSLEGTGPREGGQGHRCRYRNKTLVISQFWTPRENVHRCSCATKKQSEISTCFQNTGDIDPWYDAAHCHTSEQ